MRRPLPPELLLLGDQLEAAARRAVGRRRVRRQMVLNAVTSVLVVLPLLPAVLGTIATPVAPAEPPPNKTSYTATSADFPPRALRGNPGPYAALLVETSTLRRALR